jgi:DNA-binding GntR family transcriptional regulator
MKLYENLADEIERQIGNGVYRAGERLPSVREASRQRGLSVTTVLAPICGWKAAAWSPAIRI